MFFATEEKYRWIVPNPEPHALGVIFLRCTEKGQMLFTAIADRLLINQWDYVIRFFIQGLVSEAFSAFAPLVDWFKNYLRNIRLLKIRMSQFLNLGLGTYKIKIIN